MKNNKGFGVIGLILIIVVILIVGGGFYYLSKNSSESKKDINIEENNLIEREENNISKENLNQVNNINSNITTIPSTNPSSSINETDCSLSSNNYKNSNAGYEICYPKNWFLTKTDDSKFSNIVQIQNMKIVMSEDGFEIKNNGTRISIEVLTNIDLNTTYKEYKDIAEFVKDPKLDFPQELINERLASNTIVNIGKQKILTESHSSKGQKSYIFIFNGKLYRLGYWSGSDLQYKNDLKVFTDIVDSIKFK